MSLSAERSDPPRAGRSPTLDDEHESYASKTLNEAEALLRGRGTYEGLSAGYTAMPSNPFVDRMNQIR
jgi:hypothetical protein